MHDLEADAVVLGVAALSLRRLAAGLGLSASELLARAEQIEAGVTAR